LLLRERPLEPVAIRAQLTELLFQELPGLEAGLIPAFKALPPGPLTQPRRDEPQSHDEDEDASSYF
jgi:hypothetical protein